MTPTVLPWHPIAARDCCNFAEHWYRGPAQTLPPGTFGENMTAIIARHDPHAAQPEETVRLLEEVTNELHALVKDESDDPSVGIVGWTSLKQLVADARHHLAAIKQPATHIVGSTEKPTP